MAWGDIEVKVSKRDQTITVKSEKGLAVIHYEDIETPALLSLQVVTLSGPGTVEVSG